jgi:hypothetical protein
MIQFLTPQFNKFANLSDYASFIRLLCNYAEQTRHCQTLIAAIISTQKKPGPVKPLLIQVYALKRYYQTIVTLSC